jgi:hypothetical protein
MASSHSTQPSWWKEEYSRGWDSVREALRRDWEQTKHDLKVGGHELNQKLADTVKQAKGSEAIPASDRPNPPRVVGDAGDWEVAEVPTRYGYGARKRYGAQHPQWSGELENQLRAEWDATRPDSPLTWKDARDHVKRGYEYGEEKARRS